MTARRTILARAAFLSGQEGETGRGAGVPWPPREERQHNEMIDTGLYL